MKQNLTCGFELTDLVPIGNKSLTERLKKKKRMEPVRLNITVSRINVKVYNTPGKYLEYSYSVWMIQGTNSSINC